MKPKSFKRKPRAEKEFDERVVEIARVSRVVKGGRRIRFRALVVIGDRKGRVGMGVARANEVADAVKKAVSHAKKKMVDVPVIDGTIPYEVTAKHDAAKIILKPAAPGTSIVAGGAVRTVVELAGITDILAKVLGTRNKVNNVNAVIKALGSFDAGYVAKARDMSERSKKKIIKSEETTRIDTDSEKNISEKVGKKDNKIQPKSVGKDKLEPVKEKAKDEKPEKADKSPVKTVDEDKKI